MAEQRSILREYLEALIVAAIFLGFSNTFVVKTFYIPSPSMEDTLLVGDHLFVNRFIFGPELTQLEKKILPTREIRRGDIVIFRSPREPGLDLVKRCIAVAGDKVHLRGQSLFINGERVEEEGYVHYLDVPRSYEAPHEVPAGHIFCMGDNRDNSLDSRAWGPVPLEMVKGRAFLIYWSYGGETPDGRWYGFGHKLRQLGQTALGFFTKTRWSRTLQLIR
jgi:signal peptidase I